MAQQQFDVLLFYTVFKHGDCPLKLPEATCEKIPDYDIIPMCWTIGQSEAIGKSPRKSSRERKRKTIENWLVVSTPLKNISQLGLLFPIYGKRKNVPNHQPENIDSFHVHMVLAKNSTCEKKKSASELSAKVDSCSPVILDNSSNVT